MVPRWLRALLTVDRLVVRAHDLEAGLRDELAWACVPPSLREEVTASIYGADRGYGPGGGVFERGFFPWEARLLARADVPQRGRVLLGGAGGGREIAALREHGYQVTAFEPSGPLAVAAAAVAARLPGARVLEGAYADLGPAVRGEGRLASLRDDAPFALVLLGWRSLSHVLAEGARVALFVALTELAPQAPVIASYLPRRAVHVGRTRRVLRRALGALGAPTQAPPDAAFIPAAGFAVGLGADDMERYAHVSRRALVLCEVDGEGVALFGPAA
jgi:hypothetical protein